MKRFLCILLSVILLCGCANNVTFGDDASDIMSENDARKELSTLLKKIDVNTVENPELDIYMDDISETAALADISTFPITVQGNGDITLEIAAATELSADSPDDWINVVAKNFNRSGAQVDGHSVQVSVRKITSGEVVTYVNAGAYTPDMFIPSNWALGSMIEANGIGVKMITDRIAGNTAGILLSEEAYNTVMEDYSEITMKTVLDSAMGGEIVFSYTNPYTSATGLNGLVEMLKAFDPNDPLSSTANKALLEYQKTSPPVAYTTAVLRNQAKKGIIDAMVMEEQAYITAPELSDYVFVPFGMRHDHPVYIFEWATAEEEAAAKLFVEFCQSEESQKLATDRGFNRHEDYVYTDKLLTGQEYLTAQSLWKQNKTGGNPIVAVFVTDISGSMAGEPLGNLQQSIVAALPYIGSEHYVGLVSFSSDVTINLPIEQFNDKQRAYFSGEMKSMHATGGTHTYDAILVALDMLDKKMEEVPNAIPLIFLLTDGEAGGGYTLNRISPIVQGLKVPIYSIAYNYNNMDDLETLSDLNEAAAIRADSTDIVNQLRNLFNTQL